MPMLRGFALAIGLGAALPAGVLAQHGVGSFTVSAHSAFDTGAPFSAIQRLTLRTVEVTWTVGVGGSAARLHGTVAIHASWPRAISVD